MNFREILIRLIAMTTPYVYDQNVSLLELVRRLYSIVNELCIALQGLKDEYDDLKTYVDNYFKNLDLSSEVKTVIDEMVADGTLGNLINQDLLGNINTEITNIKSELQNVNNEINGISTNISTIQEDITGLKDYDNTNNSNILKLKNKQIVQIATCEANSNYVISNENFDVNLNDVVYIHFNQAIDNTKQATLTINNVAKNVIKDDGSLFLGSDLENTDLILKVGEAGLYQIVDIASLMSEINQANTKIISLTNEVNTLNSSYESLESDVASNTNGVNGLTDYIQLDNTINFTTDSISVLTSNGAVAGSVSTVQGGISYNKDYSKFRPNGLIVFTPNTQTGEKYLKIQTPLRPTQQLEFAGVGFVNLNEGTIGSMRAQLTTDGQLRFICAGIGQSGTTIYARIFPTDYVVKNYKESA